MELSTKGIQELKSSISELFKKFDVNPNQASSGDSNLDKIDLDFEKHDKDKIDEDMDVKFDDFDFSDLDKVFNSLMPGDDWLDTLIGEDQVKL